MDDNDDDYLRENPDVEWSLFISWVHTCFAWAETKATHEELEEIRKSWYPGKTPRAATDEILRKRK